MASKTVRNFWNDQRGNYIIATAMTMIPLCGAIGLGVDYAEMSRQRQVTLNALDAAGIATARRLVSGATDTEAKDYAKEFFEANIGSIKSSVTTLTVTLPNNNIGGGTLKMRADLNYKPYFMSGFRALLREAGAGNTIPFKAETEVRLKNTLEVALVLDNSGSMSDKGKGSSKTRIELLKDAADQLVTLLVTDAQQMKQVAKPVQISLVPFAGSVSVGVDKEGNPWSWMDTTGISPIHHENFDWTTLSSARNANKYAQKSGAIWYARGSDWGTQKDQPLTRFSLYALTERLAAKTWKSKWVCKSRNRAGDCTDWDDEGGYSYTYDKAAEWAGCVEARPSPYNVNDVEPTTTTPATLFVPMFAPDEGYAGTESKLPHNTWRDDGVSPSSGTTREKYQARQRFMPKYFDKPTVVMANAFGRDQGPNVSCATVPITQLTDVTVANDKAVIDAAIKAMAPGGATNVPEGMAWGWRTVSKAEPFTGGRPESEKGNDKVVIVLTDGENTYYSPDNMRPRDYFGEGKNGSHDNADNESTYSAHGYAKLTDSTTGRIFGGTSTDVVKTDFSNANYTKAMNEQFATLCNNAKAANVIVMTVALDLDINNAAEKTQIEALKSCASNSKYSKDESNPDLAAKLFWNSTGATLSEDFKKIAKELSNLRIVS